MTVTMAATLTGLLIAIEEVAKRVLHRIET